MSKCRFCGSELNISFIDLGMSPLANGYIKKNETESSELFYPLHAYVCKECYLVQLEEYESPQNIFSEYAYFSSYSTSWLNHAKNYTDMITERFEFDNKSLIVEIASNDGYLLQNFRKKKMNILGIEPAKNIAEEAIKNGVPTRVDFFGENLAENLVKENIKADLLIGNNVLAHVPNINDFVLGMKILLNKNGIITMEFPHIYNMIKENQFDTIYHEHFSYLSLLSVKKIFNVYKLEIFDVEELKTHGGSLRIYAKHAEDMSKMISENVNSILNKEIELGLDNIKTYITYSEKVKAIKRDILSYLIEIKNRGNTIVAYGAPAKGNTLLNYCGIGKDFLDYTVDISSYKQGLRLPGTHIPIHSPEQIFITKPDYVLILPWNIKDEVIEQMKLIRDWGGKFITLIPNVEVW